MSALLKAVAELFRILTDDGKTIRRIFIILSAVLLISYAPLFFMKSLGENLAASFENGMGERTESADLFEKLDGIGLDDEGQALVFLIFLSSGNFNGTTAGAYLESLESGETPEEIFDKAAVYDPSFLDPERRNELLEALNEGGFVSNETETGSLEEKEENETRFRDPHGPAPDVPGAEFR